MRIGRLKVRKSFMTTKEQAEELECYSEEKQMPVSDIIRMGIELQLEQFRMIDGEGIGTE